LLIISFGLIAPLGIVGAILSIKNWKKSLILYLFLLVQMITVVLFFITARYRLPVVVPLFIFSAYALVWIYECAQKQKFFKAGLTLGLFSILFIFVNTGLPGTRIKRDLAKAYFDLGFYQKSVNKNDMAIKAYRKAIEIDSSLSMAHNNLGNLLKNKGDLDLAYQAFQKAIQSNPYNYRAYNNLGILLYQMGRAKEALAKFEHALAIKPDYQIAKRNMMFVQKKLNGLEK
jgi:tetratricopeptide (TPR) repeat protein